MAQVHRRHAIYGHIGHTKKRVMPRYKKRAAEIGDIDLTRTSDTLKK
jgi:hypothetical protein